MTIHYNLLWKKLIDLGLSKTDTMRRAKSAQCFSASHEPVSIDSIEKSAKY